MFRAWFYTIRQEIVCVCKKLSNKKIKSILIALLTSCLLIVLIMLSLYFGLCLLSSFLHVISFRFLFFLYVYVYFLLFLLKIYSFTQVVVILIFYKNKRKFFQFFLLKTILQSESIQKKKTFFFSFCANYKPWYLL